MSARCLDCGALTNASRCGFCQAQRNKADNQRRKAESKAAGRLTGWAWDRRRQEVIARDGGCVVRTDCEGSIRVDHVVPLSLGGGNGVDNLRALCEKHHKQVSVRGGG